MGALELRPFDTAGSPFTLDLPDPVRDVAVAGGGIELTDPEGLVVAVARPAGATQAGPGWEVELLGIPAYGAFHRLRTRPEEVRASPRAVVPVEAPLRASQLDALRSGPRATLVVLAGHGWAAAPATDLVRGTLAATRGLDHVDIVVAPLARRGDPRTDATLRSEVLAAYGGDLTELAADGPIAPGAEPPQRSQGLVVLFTGLSGSGKSTLARALVDHLLEATTRTVTSLDGDVVRRHLSAGLGFSPKDRETNIERIGWVGAQIASHGGIAICSPIAPYDATRQAVRRMAAEAGARFVLVHVATPLAECERRDRKGLYAKARAGQIPEFTGISAPYEVPADADVVVDTTGVSVAAALAPVLDVIADEPGR